MTDVRTASARPKAILVPSLLFAMALIIALTRLHTLNEPLERDLTTYAVIGHEMRAGRPLYADLWDHKPPAIHVTYAAAEALIGYGPYEIYLLGLAAALVTLFGVYAAASAGGKGSAAGLWAAAFWTVVSGDRMLQANQPNTEVFINACLIWAFAFLLRADRRGLRAGGVLTIGLLFAIASLYKHVAITIALALAIGHAVFPPAAQPDRSHARRQAGAMMGVIVVVWIAVFGYFAAVGHLRPFYDTVFLYNRYYAGSPLWNLLKSLLPYKMFHRYVWMTVLPMIALIALGLRFGAVRNARRNWMLLFLYALGAHVAVALPGEFWRHYYQLWLPALAVGASWTAVALGRASEGARARRLRAVAPAVLLFLIACEAYSLHISPDDWSRTKYRTDLFVETRDLGQRIGTWLQPGESFYEWGGETGLYYYSQRRPLSGVFYNFALKKGPLQRTLTERVLSDLQREPPELFILYNNPADPETAHPILDWFRARYRPLLIGAKYGPFELFVRRGGRLDRRLTAHSTEKTEMTG